MEKQTARVSNRGPGARFDRKFRGYPNLRPDHRPDLHPTINAGSEGFTMTGAMVNSIEQIWSPPGAP